MYISKVTPGDLSTSDSQSNTSVISHKGSSNCSIDFNLYLHIYAQFTTWCHVFVWFATIHCSEVLLKDTTASNIAAHEYNIYDM